MEKAFPPTEKLLRCSNYNDFHNKHSNNLLFSIEIGGNIVFFVLTVTCLRNFPPFYIFYDPGTSINKDISNVRVYEKQIVR